MKKKHTGSSKFYPGIIPIQCCRMFYQNYLMAHHWPCVKRRKQQTLSNLENKGKKGQSLRDHFINTLASVTNPEPSVAVLGEDTCYP